MKIHTLLGTIKHWVDDKLARQRPDLAFILYTRAGCHLCDTAWQQLCDAQKRYGFTLDKMDVDSDPALAGQFGDCVPVVTVNGKVRFRGAVNAVLLKRLLEAI